MAGNSSLTYYNPSTNATQQEVFRRANGFGLGDCAQSMTIDASGTGWVVVNNSHVIFAIDTDTFKEKGRIDSGIYSPRYIHFVSDHKAYVTQLYSDQIAIVDPATYSVTGSITIPGIDASSGAEMMVQIGGYVYVNCWSYENQILKIDPATDSVVAVLETEGIQPQAMTADADGNLWVVTNGGYEGSPYGYEQPTLEKINTRSFTRELVLKMEKGTNVGAITTNGAGDRLYWIANDVLTMPITSTTLPENSLIPCNGNYLNGLGVDPTNGDILVADAVDYQQNGYVNRFTPLGKPVAQIPAGIIPSAFCFKK